MTLLPLLLGFAALLLLALLALLASHWPVWLKGLLVVGVSALYFYASGVLDDVWGWPSGAALPARFVLVYSYVDEPAGKRPGGIYLWLSPIEDGRANGEPRAYRLPYSKTLHTQVAEGTQKVRAGISQMGIVEATSAARTGWLRAGNDAQTLRLRDLPGPQLPEK